MLGTYPGLARESAGQRNAEGSITQLTLSFSVSDFSGILVYVGVWGPCVMSAWQARQPVLQASAGWLGVHIRRMPERRPFQRLAPAVVFPPAPTRPRSRVSGLPLQHAQSAAGTCRYPQEMTSTPVAIPRSFAVL